MKFKLPKLTSLFAAAAIGLFSLTTLASEIGSNNGISYTITESTVQKLMRPECGFTRYGTFVPGDYQVETRFYQNYDQGELISTWTETVYTLIRCG